MDKIRLEETHDGAFPFRLECECLDPSHNMRWWYDPEYDEWTVEVCLPQNTSFFKRLWYGIKYIVQGSSKWDYAEFVIRRKDIVLLSDALEFYKNS